MTIHAGTGLIIQCVRLIMNNFSLFLHALSGKLPLQH